MGDPNDNGKGATLSDAEIAETKQWRNELDAVLQQVKTSPLHTRERALAIVKVQEAIMWLGMDLKERAGGESCYTHGYDPKSNQVDPPADGVKL